MLKAQARIRNIDGTIIVDVGQPLTAEVEAELTALVSLEDQSRRPRLGIDYSHAVDELERLSTSDQTESAFEAAVETVVSTFNGSVHKVGQFRYRVAVECNGNIIAIHGIGDNVYRGQFVVPVTRKSAVQQQRKVQMRMMKFNCHGVPSARVELAFLQEIFQEEAALNFAAL